MLNFRKIRRDFTSSVLNEGKDLFEQKAVLSAKILAMNGESVQIGAQIKGLYDNVYECEIEIDRTESDSLDSNCDCSSQYDCQHIVALLFHLEQFFNEMLVVYSKETDLETNVEINDEVKQELQKTFVAAASKEEQRKDKECQKEILSEYAHAATALSANPFFLPSEYLEKDSAEISVLFVSSQGQGEIFHPNQPVEFQLVLRLPGRSKPFYVSNIKTFLDGVFYQEPVVLSGRRFFFTMQSFSASDRKLIDLLIRYVRYPNQSTEEKVLRSAFLAPAALGMILAKMLEHHLADRSGGVLGEKESFQGLFCGNLEEPLYWSMSPAKMKFQLDFFDTLYKALLMTPLILVDEDELQPEQAVLLESNVPGIIHRYVYHSFSPQIKRAHLRSFARLREITIPEALFGSFRENALPVFQEYAEIANVELLDSFVTLPYVKDVQGVCDISYLDGELEARLFFLYDGLRIPASPLALQYQDIRSFIRQDGILARNLVEERKITEEVFSGFIYDERDGAFHVKSEKKIVEFMTETIPNNQHRITFNCPETLSDQFIYDETVFDLSFREGTSINYYEAELKVHGLLKGVSLDLLWDCISAKKRFLELPKKGHRVKNSRGGKTSSLLPRILVLDLEKIAPVVQIFNEIGFKVLDDFVEKRPLWSLTGIVPTLFKDLPVRFSMTDRLFEIQKQIRGETAFDFQDVPQQIQATLRSYQTEGMHWLERLRKMHLNGILADDMGLGKTLQAIIAVTQSRLEKGKGCSLIICPTSLVYNWKEEFRKFNPNLKTVVIDGVPAQRRKQLAMLDQYDVAITSYNLLQKDVEVYKDFMFDYVVLDEAHHIKNRTTRNAKSVKMISSCHRLILTGTPIENSLEELWSLFDFLMPGLLSSYDRFVGKYIRTGNYMGNKADNMEALKRKVAPFILRRMKEDVLEDLPPVSEILYHCHLTESQKELYQSYAASAKQELSRLVKQEGFDRIHIHVLATLTRLKQICCHPAIFAKNEPEPGDSAKYDMLMDLLSSLIDSGHKTVVFSQYTKMLGIIKQDLANRGVRFVYLDGSTKNRLEIVNQFNEDPSILVFLVSLKAGGTGLNLVGADTVIHYDMWWNPAVESQATDRVHRIGQSRSVSSYKLVTLNTIEEKILTLQNRKKGLVKKVINSDDEVVSKLTWEEVLELLQI